MDATSRDRYLSLLGVAARRPSLDALAELVTAHLSRVPFENLSKLIRHRRGQPPVLESLAEFLDRVEHYRLGGTCYACASHFHALLVALGYEVRLCGAAMQQPDVHLVNLVDIERRRHLVDVGYGAPFFAPLPLDAAEAVECRLGADVYRLRPRDGEGRSRLDHLRGGEVIHGYTVDPTPRDPAYFAAIIADSYRPETEFRNHLRAVRHRPERSILVRDRQVTVIADRVVRRSTLPHREALADVLTVLLQIPREVTLEALDALPELT